MSDRLMKEMMVRLSLDMDDFRRSMTDLQHQVERSMNNVESEFLDTANKMEKLEDAFGEAKRAADKSFEKMADSARENANDIVKHFDKGFGKIAGLAKGVAGTIASAFSIYEVAQFSKSVIEAAADLEAMEATFDQVMGKSASKATGRLEEFCKTWDMELNTLKGDYTDFTAQFKGLGMDMNTALDSSDKALTLAADAAAMYNMSMEDAISHVRSFVKGNYQGGEAISLFGSQTMLASYAVQQGIIAEEKEFKELDESIKQILRLDYAQYQYELAGTTGQATRESQMYQNQLTKVKQVWTDFKAQLGTKALEGVAEAFKFISDALKSLPAEKVGEVIGEGIKKIVNWFREVDWWLVGQQLGTIWDNLSKFFEGAWDSLSTALEPIGNLITNIWDSINGDVNTENMDGVNTALVKIKPMFAWLADNGEAVGNGIIAIFSALATVKTLKLTADVVTFLTGEYKAIKEAGSFLLYVMQKLGLGSLFGDAVLPSAGSAVAGAGSKVGSMAAIELTIPLIIGFAVHWAWNLGGDPEKEAEKHGINPSRQNWLSGNKTRLQEKQSWAKTSTESKTTKYDEEGNAYFDWDSTAPTKAMKEWWNKVGGFKGIGQFLVDDFIKDWNEVESVCKDIVGWFLGISDGSSKSKQNRGQNRKIDVPKEPVDWGEVWTSICDSCSRAWDSVSNSKFGKFIGFMFGWKTAKDAEDVDNSWFQEKLDGFMLKWNGFWDDFTSSDFVTGLQTFCDNTKQTFSDWGDGIKECWDTVSTWCSDFWDDMCSSDFGQGVKNFFNGIIDIYNAGVRGILGLCNLLIDGINGIYKGLTNKETNLIKPINVKKSEIPQLAKGTDNWKGGTALVGEAGRELVSDPRLGTFMADRPMLLPLSQGAMVLRNSKTERLLNGLGIRAFAGGTNEGFWDKVIGKVEEIWSYVTDPKELWNKLLDKLGFGGISENPVIQGLANGVKDALSGTSIIDAFKAMFDKLMPDTTGIASVDGWIPMIHKAAAFFGEKLSSTDLARILQQIRNESGGNQTVRQSSAVQDINAKTGNWARGLLQYIPPTFKHYAVKGFGNINNGFHQLLAFFNNSQWRQNLPKLGERRGWSPRGARRKAKNGILVNGATPLTVGEAGQEAVVPLSNARALKPFGQSVMNAIKDEVGSGEGAVYEFTIPVVIDGREVAKATATFTKAELDKMEKRNNRLGGRK